MNARTCALGGRIGVYGGSFDPVHIGHVAVAEVVREAFGLDTVMFVPAQQSPLKQSPAADAADRVEMVRLAVSGLPWATVSTLEVSRPAPSYTVDTLRSLREETGEAALFLIVGADVLSDLASWRDPAAILCMATIVAVGRPGEVLALPPSLDGLSRACPGRIRLLECQTPPTSSRAIRVAIQRGEAPGAQVAPEVALYIASHGLYGATS